jgi:ATP-dependent DNA helicase RecG
MVELLNIQSKFPPFRSKSVSSRHTSRFKDIERVLIGMECAVKTSDGRVVPTSAGLLFFGSYPQGHLIQSDVACVLFRETVGASRYADRRIVNGTLQELIDGAELFLSRYIAVGARMEGFKRIDIPEYSFEVLREAVINAVVHRDYSKRGESVRVFCYPDRVEIHSPGLLLPGITVEQMERGEVQSKLRNPVLVGLLKDIPVQNRQSEQREQRLTKAVEYVHQHGFITNGIYRKLTGVSDRTAHRDLETLVERGRLKGTGQRAARRYRLS